jgi:hypothetical protein
MEKEENVERPTPNVQCRIQKSLRPEQARAA